MMSQNITLQNFAYQTAQVVKLQCNFDISRSHIYELIACYKGYQSYNGFRAQNLILAAKYNDSEEYYQHELLKAFTLKILRNPPKTDYSIDDEVPLYQKNVLKKGYLKALRPWDDYDAQAFLKNIQKVSIRLQHLLKEQLSEDVLFNIVKVVYRELLFLNSFSINLKSVREELSYLSFDNGQVDATEYDDGGFCSFELIEKNFAGLQKIAEQGNKDAIAILSKYYLYLANQIAPYGRDGSNFGAIWDNQNMKHIQTEQSRLNLKTFDDHIAISAKYQKMVQNSPLNVDEVDFEQIEIARVQLNYLANQGDLDAIEYILDQKLYRSLIDAWSYIYVAQELGVDFTKDDLRAYNADTGEDYDDYGPMFVDGRTAIHLPKLNDEENEHALHQAQYILQNIQ